MSRPRLQVFDLVGRSRIGDEVRQDVFWPMPPELGSSSVQMEIRSWVFFPSGVSEGPSPSWAGRWPSRSCRGGSGWLSPAQHARGLRPCMIVMVALDKLRIESVNGITSPSPKGVDQRPVSVRGGGSPGFDRLWV